MRIEKEIEERKIKKYNQWNQWNKLIDVEMLKRPLLRNKLELDRYKLNAEICFRKYLLLCWVLGDEDIEYKYYEDNSG